jgi:rubrerythrin
MMTDDESKEPEEQKPGALPLHKRMKDTVILDMALKKEDHSIRFYTALLEYVEQQDSQKLLSQLIEEEKRHFKVLSEVLVTGNYENLGAPTEHDSLEMTDHLVSEEIDRASSPQEIVKLAIRKEEASEEFYLSRIHFIQDAQLKELYRRLAEEEANHRKRLLNGYDDLIIMNTV